MIDLRKMKSLISYVVALTWWLHGHASAFSASPFDLKRSPARKGLSSSLFSALAEDTKTSGVNIPASGGTINAEPSNELGTPTAWECDDEANCVAIEACDDQGCRTSLDVRIHNTWYDLSGWRKAHPAGTHWIDWYDGRDATEVMDGFHSDRALQLYQRLPKSKPETTQLLEQSVPADSATQINFRKLRQELLDEGFWKRDLGHEATQLGLWAACVIGAVALKNASPVLSMSSLAISMSAAGWLGHDYIHGVDEFCSRMRLFAAYSGTSPSQLRRSATKQAQAVSL